MIHGGHGPECQNGAWSLSFPTCGVGLSQLIASGFTKDDYDMDGS